jgi:hypothetical protein
LKGPNAQTPAGHKQESEQLDQKDKERDQAGKRSRVGQQPGRAKPKGDPDQVKVCLQGAQSEGSNPGAGPGQQDDEYGQRIDGQETVEDPGPRGTQLVAEFNERVAMHAAKMSGAGSVSKVIKQRSTSKESIAKASAR